MIYSRIHASAREAPTRLAAGTPPSHRREPMPSTKRKSEQDGVQAVVGEKIKAKYFEKFRGKGGEGILEGEAGSSSDAGPSDLSQACAFEDQGVFFAAIPCDHLALLATPSEPLFTRTPSPTSPRSPWTYSSR